MFKYLNQRRRQGQSTLEYVVLIIIIMAALLSLQSYIKRGIQGRLKQATDDIGDQYSVGNTNVQKHVKTWSYTNETNVKGQASSTLKNNEITLTNESTYIINSEQEWWQGKKQ
jgi:hypothetical protein